MHSFKESIPYTLCKKKKVQIFAVTRSSYSLPKGGHFFLWPCRTLIEKLKGVTALKILNNLFQGTHHQYRSSRQFVPKYSSFKFVMVCLKCIK